VFPKGKREANVGVGIVGSRSGKLKAIDYLRSFVEKKFPEGKIVEMVVGGVPVSGPIECAIGNGIMLAGDAARMADPITGGGITNAMYAGRIAGEVAAKAVKQEDSSINMLREYEQHWRALLEKSLARNYRVKEVIRGFTDENLNSLAESIKGVDIQSKDFDVRILLKELVMRNPMMLFKLRNVLL